MKKLQYLEVKDGRRCPSNALLQLHTRRSWDFLGLLRSHVTHRKGGDEIIGMMDSGIWPESASFTDKGFGPPPRNWKGTCNTNKTFTCNNQNFYDTTDIIPLRDSVGHGTHTASIAAGREVAGASVFGLAQGIATGGIPNARIAVYKVCWAMGCGIADILAAFDDAIADGVDIISASFGMSAAYTFTDPVAIGSFHALKKGILTITAAGNYGPLRASISNVSPWLLTVGPSTIDRNFVTQLALGNGKTFMGSAINNFYLKGDMFPLIWGGDVSNYPVNANSETSKYCNAGDLDSQKIKGKIVLCNYRSNGAGILHTDGVGVIMPFQSVDDPAFSFRIATTLISPDEIPKVLDYIKTSKNPEATILVIETWKDLYAPYVPSFSSKGPNLMVPDILKPDLIAPGVNILAAWSPVGRASVYSEDTRSVKYYVDSGTSMSCPHVTGAAAIVKAAHPRWSPTAIKSALMTTAYVVDPKKHENEREFAYGSGLLNPTKAVDPGLGHQTCLGMDLNYPSSLAVEDGHEIKGNFHRTVTNVGKPNSTYNVSIVMPDSIKVNVEPSVLSFTDVGEKKSFLVEVNGPHITQVPIISGSITWKNRKHVVKSPLVIYNVLPSVFLTNPVHRTQRLSTHQTHISPGERSSFLPH
ncbi:subtilisin-like protease SBT4.3 isoform X1 [Prunus yedoensis var. nudiflora]|uniref:Subtilisin-like protease SBT4.3 isoform X1 n=1 Tax=Prunus yedoensis var. nudiflora TaxID=2094558 RepID=A0A314UY65_PRUYE|nr:subtilisin-like protease SBT4.3 isoform X1 [Prunus yedoensis var. nudiflora]